MKIEMDAKRAIEVLDVVVNGLRMTDVMHMGLEPDEPELAIAALKAQGDAVFYLLSKEPIDGEHRS